MGSAMLLHLSVCHIINIVRGVMYAEKIDYAMDPEHITSCWHHWRNLACLILSAPLCMQVGGLTTVSGVASLSFGEKTQMQISDANRVEMTHHLRNPVSE